MTNEAMAVVVSIPLLGAFAVVVLPRLSKLLGIVSVSLTAASVLWLFTLVASKGESIQRLGGWQEGLSIALRVDALSALMLVLTSMVALAVSVYASRYFRSSADSAKFWPLWLLLIAALNALFMSGDLFNLYVTLELLGLSAVALTALGGKRESIEAALRYLVVGLLGSLGYLSGVAILYAAFVSLDMQQVGQQVSNDFPSQIALVLMTGGLLLKTALFPLHFWLPAAHSNAPAPVSAALSALVVKAGFYLVLRLWMEVFPDAITREGATFIGLLGCAAIVWGSWQALQAERLKLLAAYSTVAQLGYLFVGLMLLVTSPDGATRDLVFGAVILMALTHGFAKSSLFLAIGVILQHGGHDRIEQLDGTSQRLPATTFAIALAGIALIGLPPSGTFLGKWHLLSTSMDTGQWLAVFVMGIGSLLAAAYVFRVLGHAFGSAAFARENVNIAAEEWPALALAMTATLVLGLGSAWIWPLLGGAP